MFIWIEAKLTTNSSFYWEFWGHQPEQRRTRLKKHQERLRGQGQNSLDEVRWFVRRWRRSTQSPDTTSSGDGWSQRAWSIAEQDGKKHMRSMLRHAKTQHVLYVSHALKKCFRYFTRLVITGLKSQRCSSAAGMVLDQSHTVSFATTRQPVLDSTDRETVKPTHLTKKQAEIQRHGKWYIYIYNYIYIQFDVNPGDILLHLSCHLLGKRFKDQHFSHRKFCRPDSPTSSWSGAWCRSTGIHCWCLCLKIIL
jgi:hypothetical protein